MVPNTGTKFSGSHKKYRTNACGENFANGFLRSVPSPPLVPRSSRPFLTSDVMFCERRTRSKVSTSASSMRYAFESAVMIVALSERTRAMVEIHARGPLTNWRTKDCGIYLRSC